MATGYSHRQYAESFAEIGAPLELPRCGGWLIERAIPESTAKDGMGCYPLFDCRKWADLAVDLTDLAGRLVSVSLVANPFGEVSESDMRRWFDIVVPYKQHYVTDLRQTAALSTRGMHSRNIRRARRRVQVTTCLNPSERLDEWSALYSQLVVRHSISGIRAFSRAAFEKQLAVPGLVMFRASVDDETVGLHLWYLRDRVAYGHLGATSALGYALMASYALYWHAIEHFSEHARWLDLGGVAGLLDSDAADGLRQFKSGWATGTRQAFLCGRVLQPSVYERLTAERGVSLTPYFPAYRHGEFARSSDRVRTGAELG